GGVNITDIAAQNRHRLVIRLANPSPLVLPFVALPGTQAVPARLPMKYIDRIPFGSLKQLPSSGRYYVASYTPNVRAVLKRNLYSRGPARGKAEELVLAARLDGPATRIASLSTGRNDLAGYATGRATDLPRLARRYRSQHRLVILPTSCVSFFILNN